MRRSLSLATFALLAVILIAPTALAHHVVDGGVDEAWNEAMNQETYWEARFATAQQSVDCTKYLDHSGFIPEEYEAAVIKDGNMVRVYASIGGAYTALGAVNPANNQHFAAPHSWVMKCNYTPITTTTSSIPDDSTTTTITEETTTTSTLPEETTTTAAPTTSVPGVIETVWSASSDCSVLVAEWGEGIVQVNLVQRLAEGDFDVDSVHLLR